ncbi:MAG: universal stress protein [Ekhidna sp.]
MRKVHRILVALDFTEMDQHLINFLVRNQNLFTDLEQVYFTHVERTLNSEESDEPLDEMLMQKVKDEVFSLDDTWLRSKANFQIIEGDPLKKLLHWSEIKKVDLLMVGRKKPENGSGILMQRLARKIRTSVLVIPPRDIEINKILVSLDFSEHAELALKKALQIAGCTTNPDLTGYHLFQIPSGYTKTGKTYEEMKVIMAQNAETHFTDFLKKCKVSSQKIKPCIEHAKFADIADKVIQASHELKSDMIIIGSKGQTFASWVLLGSIAERLIVKNDEAALLIVKKKNENFGFWQAFKEF